ncbi:hypothetical protein [Azohydromonas aeria]|uniref:hypothetical protein n=1 Tax=Azohydromonas aeria TaxID=2590212 RepID=UPI0012F97878|nr:hypothetical protein [Azohydromonas aeria]
MSTDPSRDLEAVDMVQALEDFDGNHASVSGLLRDFLGDRRACSGRLLGLEEAATRRVVAALHDVANTLDAGWCRQAALAVRSREEGLRRADAAVPLGLLAEVQAIVEQAFDGVEAVVQQHCPRCLLA